jgi:chorismate mutase/prephenate dehydratase
MPFGKATEMARKADGPSNRPSGSLASLRSQVDKLDQQILKLINERARVSVEIGKVKQDQSGDVFAPAREEEVIQNLLAHNQGPLEPMTVRAIYREIMSGSRALQKMMKIAYLGGEYSFSHLAVLERFGQSFESLRVNSISAVFEEVNGRHADIGVVPLENSTDGRVADTLEMFIRLPHIKICSEIRLRVHHHLLANCDQPEIRRIYSKGNALSQCRNWLAKNVPHASQHEVSSTADAARLAQTEPGAAAVASRQAAVRYGLRILFENIEDSPHNETRFAVIGSQEVDKTGNDKTALMFKVPHNPGALVDALNLFKQNKINLSWIESFPAPTQKAEYIFFVDFEGHHEDPKVKRALALLEKECEMLTILGSFPIAPLVGE